MPLGRRETNRARRRRVARLAARSIVKLAVSTTGASGSAAAPPQRGSQAGEQLVHPEGLGHVVVGARVECDDLVVLALPRRQHDDRRLAPAAQALDHLASRPCPAARDRAPRRRAAGSRPPPERLAPSATAMTSYLRARRLIVERPAEGRPRPRRPAPGSSRERQTQPHGQAAAGRSVGDQDAVHGLDEPACDREPEPDAVEPPRSSSR